jgi:hypothetical protein
MTGLSLGDVEIVSIAVASSAYSVAGVDAVVMVDADIRLMQYKAF